MQKSLFDSTGEEMVTISGEDPADKVKTVCPECLGINGRHVLDCGGQDCGDILTIPFDGSNNPYDMLAKGATLEEYPSLPNTGIIKGDDFDD